MMVLPLPVALVRLRVLERPKLCSEALRVPSTIIIITIVAITTVFAIFVAFAGPNDETVPIRHYHLKVTADVNVADVSRCVADQADLALAKRKEKAQYMLQGLN